VSDVDKLIINAAITGMVPGKGDSPYVPTTVDEIVASVRRVRDAGASIIHLHARDERGEPTSSGAAYLELVSRVREAVADMVICVSLSGRCVGDISQRAAPLIVSPDMASLTLGSLNFPRQASVNTPETICALAARIRAVGAVPELEVFEPGFINYSNYLIRQGVLEPPFYYNLILGSLGASALDLIGLGHMIASLPEGATWAVGGIGRYQLDANALAIAAGGHVRVGLEDNLYYDRQRETLATNPRLVERVARIGRELGREAASPREAGRIIGLPRFADQAIEANRDEPAVVPLAKEVTRAA
jgi:uncharacterized protein (DUF849 family)